MTVFPFHEALDDFECAFQPSIDERQMRELAVLAFVDSSDTLIFLGLAEAGLIWPLPWASRPFREQATNFINCLPPTPESQAGCRVSSPARPRPTDGPG